MNQNKIPLIVLGGRDLHLAEITDNGRRHKPVQGYKGANLKVGGRPLIQLLIDRMTATGMFSPVLIAGPSRIYGPLVEGAEIIETDGTFGENLSAGVEWVRQELKTDMVAVTTCDILPDPEELAVAMQDLRDHQPFDYWMPQIRVPDDSTLLGASDWKPRYRLIPEGEKKSVAILPGHIIVCNPEAVRLKFVYRFFDILYRTRNRPLTFRRLALMRALLWSLVVEDLKRIASLRYPRIFFPVVYNSLLLASKLKAGVAPIRETEDRIRRVFIKADHRLKFPERRGWVLLSPALSLAKDIDTEEEARELEGLDGI